MSVKKNDSVILQPDNLTSSSRISEVNLEVDITLSHLLAFFSIVLVPVMSMILLLIDHLSVNLLLSVLIVFVTNFILLYTFIWNKNGVRLVQKIINHVSKVNNKSI